MRLALFFSLLAAAPTFAQAPSASVLERYQATITPSELAGLLYVYADDYMAGRDTGAPGQRFASRFLAGQYQAMGVQPHGSGLAAQPYDIAPYLQPFDLERSTLRSLSVTATRGGENIAASTIRAGETDSVFDGLDMSGAYAIALSGTAADPSDQAATQARFAALGAAGVRGVLLPVAPTATALAPRAARAFRAGEPALPEATGAESDGGRPPLLFTSAAAVRQMLGDRTFDQATPPTNTDVMLSVAADRPCRPRTS